MARSLTLRVSDGHLQEWALRLLTLAGLLARTCCTYERCYLLTTAVQWLSAQFARPAEIAAAVCRGDIDLGICGLDWIEEVGATCVKLCDLAFGRVDVKLLVPKAWTDVTSVADLLHRRLGGGLVVWAELLLLTRRYFMQQPSYRSLTPDPPALELLHWHEERTASPVTIRLSMGKTEAKEVLVDVVDTGLTAEANGKKAIATLLPGSTAWLIASHAAIADPWKAERINEIADALRSARVAATESDEWHQ